MKGTVLLCWMTVIAVFSLTSCDWTSEATKGHNTGNMTGLYEVVRGEVPFRSMTIWQTGNSLRAQDSRGMFWEGQTGTDIGGGGGFQVFLQLQNQKTGMTEWMRGDVSPAPTDYIITNQFTGEEITFTGAIFSATYSRSDRAQTSPVVLLGPNLEGRWPSDTTPVVQ